MSTLLGGPRVRSIHDSKDANASGSTGDVQIFIGGDRRKSCMGRIRRVSTGTMELVFPQFISPSQNVEVIYSGCRVEARVIRCTELSSDHYLGTVRLLRCAGMEMRDEPRVPVHLDAVLHAFGSAEKLPIRIVDISHSGLGVSVPVTLAVGQQVAVDVGKGVAMAEVRYCRVTPEGRRAGLQILEFLDREVPVSVTGAGMKEGDHPGLNTIMSLIRNKHNDLVVPEPEKS